MSRERQGRLLNVLFDTVSKKVLLHQKIDEIKEKPHNKHAYSGILDDRTHRYSLYSRCTVQYTDFDQAFNMFKL